MSDLREALRLLTANSGMELTDDAKAAARLLEASIAGHDCVYHAAPLTPGDTRCPQFAVCAICGQPPRVLASQPAAAVSDEEIDAVSLAQWGPHHGAPLAAHRAFARAILALRPQAYPLLDDLYDSKDWRQGNYASRVEWLHTMYEHAKQERDGYAAQLAALRPQAVPMTDEQVDRIWNALPMGNGFWLSFARAVEAHHGITQRADGGEG